ncbi:hypothetical protein PUNSTDRAFT_55512 [Punctularia strigosozonata HHB-11173 SS5]|uniref:Uncharacterized protein n=1 Tax=Punctularia strigosozonata (strain HHB-11173) TaxID=741275 RepID=R7S3V6_PUNST|nr:uncharacterized protein PUNSTDRAFT_55512 [Punctularia strigosozonata HHB-11173 SS5]EIN04482.1 hypothetical protein PUNSTDRAFT_55512 [Punctularia strigosozonata HHB-11173 SS5]
MELERRELEAAASLLLVLVAPSVRTLFSDFWPITRKTMRPASFPHLTALSLSSRPSAEDLPPLPSLTHLHIASCWAVNMDNPPFWDRLSVCPFHATLSHLRLSGVRFGAVAEYLRIQLDVPVIIDDAEVRRSPLIPAHFKPGSERERRAMEDAARLPMLKNVWIDSREYAVQGWCGTSGMAHVTTLSDLRALAKQIQTVQDDGADGRKLVIFPTKKGEYGLEQMLEDWSTSVAERVLGWSMSMHNLKMARLGYVAL